jgi:hypothetical protein
MVAGRVEHGDRRLGHLEEHSGQVVQRLRHHDLRVIAERRQPLDVRVHLAQRRHVGGVEQRA